jgi:excisionase family DNA binding protein
MSQLSREIPALLTIAEVASSLRVSDETIRRRVADGSLRSVRFGGIIRVPALEPERVLHPANTQAP